MFCVIIFFVNYQIVESCIPTQILEVPIEFPTTTTSSTTSTTTTTTSTTTPEPIYTCPTDWTKFDRGTYYWCMYIYIGPVQTSNGPAICQSLDSSAVPTGFQNANEMSAMAAVVASRTSDFTFMLLGASRTAVCVGQILTATCTYKTSFYWTDQHTTGTDQFIWDLGNGSPENTGLIENWAIWKPVFGMMDDQPAYTWQSGVLCGVEATVS
ncbi:unnamed protein product [Caenorhabditis angaria]|uniref:C-type lectin domain-containing protein n=1 Tax=Caenorhabditis angaria TaxID=860376 RepID=A0A9P1ILZ4_9PELO|nr:unnamed protein product [Caenorhabditis angaria]